MSDYSRASRTITTDLSSSIYSATPNEFINWMSFNFKIFLWIITISLVLACINLLFMRRRSIMYHHPIVKSINGMMSGIITSIMCRCEGGKCKCKEFDLSQNENQLQKNMQNVPIEIQNQLPIEMRNQLPIEMRNQLPIEMRNQLPIEMQNELPVEMQENFSNDEMYSYKSSMSSNYQSIPLLAPLDENKNPENLFFGKANRFIYKHNDEYVYSLEIYCNLLVLDGNIYDKAQRNTIKQKYKVYLVNSKTKETSFLDNLVKDGDGIYKLKYKSNQSEALLKYDIVKINYSLDDKEQTLLQGNFV